MLHLQGPGMSQAFHFSPRPNRAHEIHWNAWGPEAFARAQAEDKPILLALSAVWCHWCHVMDETTYSTAAVIGAINDNFVPVRVDNDHRPDVNARYNMGGWPTTAFLMPGGETITGTTYVPPEQMEPLLARVLAFYHERKGEIRERLAAEPAVALAGAPAGAALGAAIVERVMDAVTELYDPAYGGFGTAPKFPMTDALELLLTQWQRTREPRLRTMLEKSLYGMADHGLYDHVEGGWFRYSTDREWRVPHFEKMSEDHAGLLRVNARYARATADVHLRERVASATSWLMSTLYDESSGLFGGSQDADEHYYALSLEERRATAAPYVDRTAYTNWTAALAGALFEVAPLLEDATLTRRALRALDVLWERMCDGHGLLYHVLESGGRPQTRGLLTDQTALLRALLDAHAATGEARMLARAEQLADEIVAVLAAKQGGFYDRVPEDGALGFLAVPDRPLAENAALADSLLRLSALTDRPDLRERGLETLLLFAHGYEKIGAFAAPYALAVMRALTPPATVTIITGPDAAAATSLRAAAATSLRAAATTVRLSDPLLDVRTLDASAQRERVERSGYRAEGPAVAYVCVGATCAAPAHTAHALTAAYAMLTGASAPIP
ncbi:thioredoxin domain-containing protein [bacterium]|nr:MAG: thioredoxin domain-containing protein [bacterium]